jgi:hypothetical protein
MLKVSIDLEETFKAQVKAYSELNLVLPTTEPPVGFNTVSVRCFTETCNYTNTMCCHNFMDQVILEWATINWKIFSNEFKNSFSYDEYFTKYLADKNIEEVLKNKNLEQNPVIKDLIKYIEKERIK